MLGGLFVLGLMYGLIIRYFMALKVPWILREGVVLGFVFSVAHNGVEMSLPKIFGAMVMFVLVYALLARFAFPPALNWLRVVQLLVVRGFRDGGGPVKAAAFRR